MSHKYYLLTAYQAEEVKEPAEIIYDADKNKAIIKGDYAGLSEYEVSSTIAKETINEQFNHEL